MKKRKHVRKLISLLLVMALMSTCLGIGSVSVSADDRNAVVRRGLCICGSQDSAPWFVHSIARMNSAFANLSISSGTFYNTSSSSAPVISRIHATFANADNNDINYLFLCGHGFNFNEPEYQNGMNVGNPGRLYYSDLRTELDSIPGHFIIFIMSCYSGQAITPLRGDEANDQDACSEESPSLEEQILNAFFDGIGEETINRNGELAGTAKYTVFCSAEANLESSGIATAYTYATYAWALGLGYQINSTGTGGTPCPFYADTNNDGIVIASELHNYAYNWLTSYTDDYPCYYSKYYFRTIGMTDYPLGDPSRDGDISNADVLLIQKHLLGLISLDANQLKLADVSGDGNVTDTDKQYIQCYLAGIPL